MLEREFNLHHYGKPIGLHAVARWLRREALPCLARLRTLADWLEVELTELVSAETAYKINKVEKTERTYQTHLGDGHNLSRSNIILDFLKLTVRTEKK